MRNTTRLGSALAAGILAFTTPLAVAAQAAAPTIFDVTPYAGVMMFGDYMSGPLGTSITNAPASLVGAQFGVRIAPNLSLIGNLATTSSEMQAGVPFFGGVSVAKSTLLLYDAGVQLDLPMSTLSGAQLSPFVQAGAGAMRYDLTESFLSRSATNLAGNVAIGADLGVGRGVGVRVMAKDFIGNFNVQDATMLNVSSNTTQSYAFTAGLRFSF